MTEAREALKADIEQINDIETIEKIRIFVMGLQAATHGKTILSLPPPNSPPPALPPAG